MATKQIWAVALACILSGCHIAVAGEPARWPGSQVRVGTPNIIRGDPRPVIHTASTGDTLRLPASAVAPDSAPLLLLPEFVDAVIARNPSVQAMAAAWRAASQRYPQAVSLEDPMFMAMAAPASFGSNQVEDAYALQTSQKFPGHGKRAARGAGAQAEASVAGAELRDTHLQVAEAAQIAYLDYYLARKQLELNQQNISVMRDFRSIAQSRYESGSVTAQDVIQADVELTDLERRQIELQRLHRVSLARMNTLLLQPPDASLPPPVQSLTVRNELPPAPLLRQIALERRPDLAAIAARLRTEQAAVELARADYYPDVDLFGRYDTFWQPASTQSDLRAQIGVNVNVPLYKRRREAAICEATFRAAQRRAEYNQRVADVQYQVQSAYEEVVESKRTADLYTSRFLPLGTQNVGAARANYDTGKAGFLALAQTQRQLIELRERQQQAIADYYRRTAQLQRVVGGPLPQVWNPENVRAPVPTIQNGFRTN